MIFCLVKQGAENLECNNDAYQNDNDHLHNMYRTLLLVDFSCKARLNGI